MRFIIAVVCFALLNQYNPISEKCRNLRGNEKYACELAVRDGQPDFIDKAIMVAADVVTAVWALKGVFRTMTRRGSKQLTGTHIASKSDITASKSLLPAGRVLTLEKIDSKKWRLTGDSSVIDVSIHRKSKIGHFRVYEGITNNGIPIKIEEESSFGQINIYYQGERDIFKKTDLNRDKILLHDRVSR